MAQILVIHIPGDIEPLERGDRFEDPLDKALKTQGRVGKCVGGGTALDTKLRVTGCDIDVEVKDLAKALPVIRDALVTAQAPAGTTVTQADAKKPLLRFTKSGVKEFAPSTRKARKPFEESCPWERGEVLAYRIRRDRYILLHVCGFGGIGPVFWAPEWCEPEIPHGDEIVRIIRKKPEHYRLGAVYEVWRKEETDRDERRLLRTGVVVPPPPSGLRVWFPGLVEVRSWKEFERILKEFFGLVAVSPGVRLSHDLGLDRAIAHFAVWHPAGLVNKEQARRLFYGHASGFRRTHPDRVRQPVTEALKAFVDELKARFAPVDAWDGTFSAREGFVIIPVKRKKLAAVWAEVTKLARPHGLACYDPEAEQLQQRKRF